MSIREETEKYCKKHGALIVDVIPFLSNEVLPELAQELLDHIRDLDRKIEPMILAEDGKIPWVAAKFVKPPEVRSARLRELREAQRAVSSVLHRCQDEGVDISELDFHGLSVAGLSDEDYQGEKNRPSPE